VNFQRWRQRIGSTHGGGPRIHHVRHLARRAEQLLRRVSVLVVVRRAFLFLLASLLAVPLLPVPAAHSQTAVFGRIEQDTTWTQDGSPFVLIGPVVVVADVTLTIEPGVQVRGTAGSSLVVKGALRAVGTQAERIVFTGDTGQQDWSGIHLTMFRGLPSVSQNRPALASSLSMRALLLASPLLSRGRPCLNSGTGPVAARPDRCPGLPTNTV